MATAAKGTEEILEAQNPYSVNKTLFEESTKVKNQLELVQKRLEKMEEHRSQVSDAVYLKVKTDYETQLEEVNRQFQEKCREIEVSLQGLYQAQKEQEIDLARHEEILEEAKFRHTLGEYTDKKYKEVETQQNKEIKNFKGVIAIIRGSIEQYEGILGQPFNPEAAPSPEPSPEKDIQETLEEILPPEPSPTQTASTQDLLDESEHTPATGVPNTPAPAPEKAKSEDTSEAFDQELDSFLQSEGSYFEEEAPTPAAPEPKPEAEPKRPTPPADSKPDEDSISKILRDIPIEPGPSEGETKVASATLDNKGDTEDLPPEASLLLLEGDLDEHEFILGENTSIGRSPSNDLVLKETKISRQHAAINFRDGNYLIVDLKSSNGIFINDKKEEEATLQDGDEVRIGSFKFQFNLL